MELMRKVEMFIAAAFLIGQVVLASTPGEVADSSLALIILFLMFLSCMAIPILLFRRIKSIGFKLFSIGLLLLPLFLLFRFEHWVGSFAFYYLYCALLIVGGVYTVRSGYKPIAQPDSFLWLLAGTIFFSDGLIGWSLGPNSQLLFSTGLKVILALVGIAMILIPNRLIDDVKGILGFTTLILISTSLGTILRALGF
jgi:hypothetical protein